MPKETNKDKALMALLGSSSVTEASRASGLSARTIHRFLSDEDFKKEYRDARRTVFQDHMAQLQQHHAAAVEAVLRNLNCENPAVEVRAAAFIIEQTRKDFETFDLVERLENLENELTKKN